MQQTFTTPGPPRLEIRNPAGDVLIETAETGETTVALQGSDELVGRAVVELRGGGTVHVEIPERRGFLGFGSAEDVDVLIRCPAGARALVRTKSADLTVRGPLADLDATTASGALRAEEVAGNASFKSASGDVRVESVGGDLTVHTASGDVVAGPVGGAAKANVVSGDVRVESADGPVTVNSVSGDQEIGAVAAGAVTLQSVSGDVRVGIRRGSRVYVDAATLSGDPRSELDLGADPGGDDGPLVELRIKTVSGDVSIVRAPERTPQEVS